MSNLTITTNINACISNPRMVGTPSDVAVEVPRDDIHELTTV